MKRIERKLHKMIEEEGREETARAWARLEARLNEMPQYNTPKKSKKRLSPKLKKILVSCASVAVVVAAGLGFSLGFGLQKPVDEDRYCSANDYVSAPSEKTLKDYVLEYQVNVLYLDWYDEAGEYFNTAYKLKETEEIVCFHETLTDEYWNYVNLYVTDNKTDIDLLEQFNFNGEEEITVNNIPISYKINDEDAFAKFEYQNYRYFIEINFVYTDLDYTEHTFNIVEQLLQSANG